MTVALTAMLYVPGGAQDKLDNIGRLDAKAYILDLEDAVAVSAKPTARRLVAAAIERHGPAAALYVLGFDDGRIGLTGLVRRLRRRHA